MIHSVYINPQHQKTFELSPADIQAALQRKEGLLWISLEQPTPDESLPILQDLFHFHPLAIEDAMSEGYQTAKVDDFGSYLFIIMHALITDPDDHGKLDTVEVNLFLGENFLVSIFHNQKIPAIEAVWKRVERDERVMQNGSDFLCHSILDSIIDEYAPTLDQIDDALEALEDQVIERPRAPLLERLIEMKHSLIFLRRVLSPQREVMNRLSRDDFALIDAQSRIYYRDIYDHLVRYQDQIESLRDIVSGGLDIYLNSTSLRLNEVMRALTVVSTIFLPLSFVAGIYGMNFDFMPELHFRYGYLLVWLVFIATPVAMLYYFKRKGWF